MLAQNARSARATLRAVDEFTTIRREATEIRTQMIAMSDAMRGFLLNPARREESDAKKRADEALSAAVDRLLARSSDPKYNDLAKQIGALDERELDPVENRVLDLASTEPSAAAAVYFKEYLPIRERQM